MNTSYAISSGIIQGLTEFFPVSSSGHLVIFHYIIGQKESIIFDIILHLGTLFAVLVYFWKDCVALLLKERKTLYLLIAASIPTFIIALLFKDFFESAFENPRLVGYSFIITACLIFTGTFLFNRYKNPKESINLSNALLIGLAQGAAIIPGISRSGATISTGLSMGVDKLQAFKFSFLLSVPVILGAVVFKARDIVSLKSDMGIFNIFLGFIISFLVGLAAISLLKKILIKNYFSIFSVYCILLGITVLIFIK